MLVDATARINLLSGAISSGKTVIANDLAVTRAGTLPPGNMLWVGKTLDTLTRNVIHPLQERVGDKYISSIHGSPKRIEVFGRPVYVVGANDERAYRKIQGISLVYAYTDELTSYPESFAKWLLGRLRIPGATWDGTLNPEGPFHYVKREFIDRAGELDIKPFHFTIDDNPFLDPAYVTEMKRAYTGVWYNRLILGLWVAAEGAIYDMFSEANHSSDLPAMRRYWIGCDYGTTNPTVFLLVGQGDDNRLYVVDEWRWDSSVKGTQKTDAEYSRELARFVAKHSCLAKLQWVFIDPSAASFRLQVHNDHINLRSKLSPANNDVLDGIRRVGSLFSIHRLLVDAKRCAGLTEELTSYVWDTKAAERGEDAPVKQHDHGPDALRYVINGTRHIWEPWLRSHK